MEREKRKKYFIITNIFWWIGFVLYGGLAVAGKALLEIPINGVLLVLINSMMGGLLIGGLSCGFILFFTFFYESGISCQDHFMLFILAFAHMYRICWNIRVFSIRNIQFCCYEKRKKLRENA